MLHLLLSLLALLLLSTGPAAGAPLTPERVPEPLKPWVSWALHERSGLSCPFAYDDHNRSLCHWPDRLSLKLGESGGTFAQEWRIWEEGWVTLPGDARHWPQEVQVDGQPATVVGREGVPVLFLTPGQHQVRGQWFWERLPESVEVPPEVGLVSLTVRGEAVARPNLDAQGRLWLRAAEQPAAEEDRLALTVQRKISDDIPLYVTTRIEMDVAGRQREVVLPQPLNAGYLPVSLISALPVALEPDGQVRVQVRPGHWVVELGQRHLGPAQALHLEKPAGPGWVEEEVWVFAGRNHLRQVTVAGAPAIDPQQTTLPQEWRGLPAYLLRPGDTLQLKERKRGGGDQAPDLLQVNRTWWLDFDGGGYTVRDEVQGLLNRPGRMEMAPAVQLGRVAVGGRDQLITQAPGSSQAGVELPRGEVALVAEGRLARGGDSLPAVGWRRDVQQLSGLLQLPPGWRLWYASGVDQADTTWLNRWTLLDLFVVWVVTLAVGKLWHWRWIGLAAPAMILIHHEEPALAWILLNLLVATALLRVAPAGWARRLGGIYRWATVAVLVVVGLPFLVTQAQLALHPQLEQEVRSVWPGAMATLANAPDGVPAEAPRMVREERAVAARAAPPPAAPRAMAKSRAPEPKQNLAIQQRSQVSRDIDPNARVQTGPGLPQWSWRTVRLHWNGPVGMEQELSFWLTPPWVNRGLAAARVVLLLGLAGLLLGGAGFSRWGRPGALAVLAAGLLLGGLPSNGQAAPPPAQPEAVAPTMPRAGGAPFPSEALLEQLGARLGAPPTCLPGCAELARMELTIAGNRLRLRLEAHAAQMVAIPLPGGVQHWLPDAVLVDGVPATGLMRGGEGALLLALPGGRHQVTLEGALPGRDSVQLPLPMRPRRVTVTAEGWQVAGLGEEGVPEETLALQRLAAKEGGASRSGGRGQEGGWQPVLLPPLLQVERELQLVLGQEWRVRTTVRRLSPAASAVILELPLLPGESVTSSGLRVTQGKVQLNMAAGSTESAWDSVLPMAAELTLKAGADPAWHEVWRLEANPVWHVEARGIPAVPPPTGAERWSRLWRPWPGEELHLTITRPAALPGQTLTLERSELSYTPGLRATEATLKLQLKSSRGDQHRLTLPEGAELQGITLNGAAQPVAQEGRQVTLPITPGMQEVLLTWRHPEGISAFFATPVVDLGLAGVNAHLHLKLPRDRWLWWGGGPALGPAVLFWGGLAVVGLVALGLGRLAWTPLTTVHWLLLGAGFITVSAVSTLLVAAWFLVLGWRGRRVPNVTGWWRFNLLQLGLILLTVLAVGTLVGAIQQGLLGFPDMQVSGNGSSQFHLHWYQDRHGPMPEPGWALTWPLMGYRLLMLGWSLWLAASAVKWAKWAWEAVNQGEFWRSRPPREPGRFRLLFWRK